jgi:DNA ligase-associated metallophosphoesterase
MNGCHFKFFGADLTALPSGALWWDRVQMLCVSDLHLGKSERMARRGGPMLPPYEVRETLGRLEADIHAMAPEIVVCLGDSFDDLAAAHEIDADTLSWLNALMAGRRWIWIEGNHDAGPVDIGGTNLHTLYEPPLMFRHIAQKTANGEVSGHYHPKTRLNLRGRVITRRSFLFDASRLILPAYGTYTGGLETQNDALSNLMAPDAKAILLNDPPLMVPMPR